ncbi:MAG: filamentous hemagglutinin N-terminal domain-containing protein [Verrucomicrobiota bacterium]
MKNLRFTYQLALTCLSVAAFANPAGLTVQSGNASVTVNGNQFNITASHNAFLNWQSFNIAAGETTRFIQPSASSVVWNRINDANPSQIYGNLVANGVVVLMNQNGFYFGPNSFVSAAGLVVSTAPFVPAEGGGGLFWQFTGPPPSASIINYGQFNIGAGGSAFLIAEHIENHGQINAPGGNIGLLAGQEVLLSERPDGRGLSASVTLPSGSVNNSGELIADAGTIALNARVVNQNGLVQANSIREHNGIIELFATDTITLGDSSINSANGDAAAVSAGGNITIKSDVTFADSATSQINVAGGGLGGDGGFVEVSAPLMSAVQSRIDGSARSGSTGGRILIDPLNITIGNSGSGSAGSGTVGSGDAPVAGTLNLDVNSAFIGFSQITLQALNNITLSAGTFWDLPTSTGLDLAGSTLKLEAGNNITIGNGDSILGGEHWSVTLQAGRDFTAVDKVKAGVGNIALSGTGAIETGGGNINLLAGNNITVNSGFIHTIGGGNITAEAAGGSINTGNRASAYIFGSSGYELEQVIDPNTGLPSYTLGGISTARGGDVHLKAKWDVLSYIPIAGDVQTDAGSGAFGAETGNVTVEAGRYVAGHFMVRNGVGVITAGRDAGFAGVPIGTPAPTGEPNYPSSRRLLDLSLVNGSWSVTAANNILLNEVRNPNGILNNANGAAKHLFDYAADAAVTLAAGNSVQLLGEVLPRYTDEFERNIPPIYPGTLTVAAGKGGVILGNDVRLYPSPTGNLRITTTGNGALGEGSLVSTKVGDLAKLIVSDSGRNRYANPTDFGINDHAATPLHLADTDPVELNIAGDMTGTLLAAPKAAVINVGRDLINSRFDGQNLHAGDVTRLNVGRDIKNDNEYTSVTLTTPPDFSVFALVYPPLPGLAEQFFYDTVTKTLSFKGSLTQDQLNALKGLRVRTFDQYGFPVVDASGEPVTAPATFVSAAKLDELYANGLNLLLSPDTGYRLGGGGQFNITARNLDLGATIGIVSQGPRGNLALAKYFTRGADINVSLSGNLDMFFTKIASVNGGNITVLADHGYVTVGSRATVTADQTARGIFTTDQSDITVIARDDIDVNGSRIAAYDGGNVFVRSLEGDVDAGTGTGGAATVEKIYVDPVTRAVLSYSPTIPGSGILATTFPPAFDPAFPKSRNSVGNITVETPRGDIKASAGGIVQIPLNGVNEKLGTVTLTAGTKDADGNVLYVGNIDATGSGVIGSTVKLDASGDIKGVVFARDNLDIKANQNVSVTALAVGSANVSAGDTISGTIIGVGSVNASGSSVDAALLSQNVTASGDVSSTQVGFAQANAAAATSQGLQADNSAQEAVSGEKKEDDDELKKGRPGPRIARTSGRVTVILPEKKS